jgi:hypothetical protein
VRFISRIALQLPYKAIGSHADNLLILEIIQLSLDIHIFIKIGDLTSWKYHIIANYRGSKIAEKYLPSSFRKDFN